MIGIIRFKAFTQNMNSVRFTQFWMLTFLFSISFSFQELAAQCSNLTVNYRGQYGYTIIGNSESTTETSPCGEINGTSRTLTIPSGSTIASAHLYWSGSTSPGVSDLQVTLNGTTVNASSNQQYVLNSGGVAYNWYSSYANVTSLVSGSGTFTVNNLEWDVAGNECSKYASYGGWVMVVVYQNTTLPMRDISLYSNFYATFNSNGYDQYMNLCNLNLSKCMTTSELSIIEWEGDSYKGEYTYINGVYQGDNLLNGNNSFDGTSNYNLDIDKYNTSSIVNSNTTNIEHRVTSYNVGASNELHMAQAMVFQYNLVPLNVVTSPDVSICLGSSKTITASATGGASPYSYSWSNSLGTGSSKTVSPSITTTYTVTATDANGCTGTDNITITVTPNPTVSINPVSTNICNSQSVTLSATSNSSCASVCDKSYSVPSFTTAYGALGSNLKLTWHNSTDMLTFQVTLGAPHLTLTNGAYLYLVVTPGPDPTTLGYNVPYFLIGNGTVTAGNYNSTPVCNFSYPCSIVDNGTTKTYSFSADITTLMNCLGMSAEMLSSNVGIWLFAPQYYTTNGGNGNYTVYDIINGSTANCAEAYLWSNGATTKNISVSPSSTTTYTVTVTDCSGCTATSQSTVNVNQNMTANAGLDKTMCLGVGTSLTTNVVGGTPNYTYLWSPGNMTSQTININPSVTTTYAVTVTDALGCTATDNVIVTVANASANAGIDQIITCTNPSATLTATGGGTYLWSNSAITQTITVSPNVSTTYTVTVTATNGCTATDDVLVTVNKTEVNSGISGPNTICALDGAFFQVSPPVTGATYLWNFDGATPATSTASSLSVTWPTSMIGTTRNVSLTVTTADGCTETFTHPINISQNATANAGPDREICEGASTTLGGTPAGPTGATFVWTPNLYLNSNTVANPLATPPVTITYTLTTAINGCTKTDEITVTVNTNLNPLVSATAC
jgi:hypothetical protein